MNQSDRAPQVVVSMTSFPAAIPWAAGAVRSLLNGTVVPDKLVLYLTFAQFGETGVPSELLRLAEENPVFEIRDYGTDIRSYRKLIPALKDFPEAIIVTVDDDVAYGKDMLKRLLEMHQEFPDAIIAHRAKRILPGRPYKKWPKYRWYSFLSKRIHNRYSNIQTGVGGVLYPPHSLSQDMMDPALFTAISPTADDIWFWAAGVANGRKVIPVPFGQNKPRGLGKPKNLSLKITNFKRGTDRNLASLNAILEKYPIIRQRLEDDDR